MHTRVRIIILIILVLSAANIWSQEASKSLLLEEIRKESFNLALLEEEVEYFQQLVNKRMQVKKLEEQNRVAAIRELFERDLAELEVIFESGNTERAVKKIWEVNRIYKGIAELDIKNYFPERLMEYYLARIDVLDGKYKKAQKTLEKLLADNIAQNNRNDIVLLLEEVYFNLGNYQDYVSVFPLYRGLNSARQRWWLGQSLYNTGKYDEASTVFKRLENDETYGLRSRCMSILITYRRGDTEKAISDFLTLKFRYDPKVPYYNFINLTLARLYAITGNTQEAINLYDQYAQLEKDIPDEILYEIATIYKNFGEYTQAIVYYNKITQKSSKSRYYVAAKYFMAITEQDRGNYDSGREHLREIIEKNDDLMLALNEKYALLENYSSKLQELIQANSTPEERSRLDRQLADLESQFQVNREKIESYSEGVDSEKIVYLKMLEEEYFNYTITLANYEAFVRFSRNPMIKRLPSVKNYAMTHTDSSVVYLQVVDYVEKVSNKSAETYIMARFMAEQKVYLAFVRDIWFDIKHLALDYDVSEIDMIADKADSLISSNLQLITELESNAFNNTPGEVDKRSISEKRKQIEYNNKQLEKIESEFIDSFSVKITPKLVSKVEDFAESQNQIRNQYIETITAMVEALSDENRMYENTLLDILYRQTRLLDEEYIEFREKLTNENKN